jgi:hypothetical protein
MARQLVGVALLALVMTACSSTPLGTNEQGSTESDLGSINLPLTTTVSDGTVYHLKAAAFTITGEALAAPRVVKPPVDEAIHNEALPVGTYSIVLAKGWVLEKMAVGSKLFTPVVARLVTPNPLTITVGGKLPADAFFGFATTSGDVSLGQGSTNIRIGVSDCSAYDTFTAALGGLTVDCRGTLDPRDYKLDADGFLVPAFEFCPNDPTQGKLLREIRQLLSLQARTARLPFAKECLAGRFDAYAQKLPSLGVDVCPTWANKRVFNLITDKEVAAVIDGLPKLPAEDTGRPPPNLELLKQNSFYTASFGANVPKQKCESPGNCATLCAGAFPGFVLSNDGPVMFTDPTAWLLDTTYVPPTPDPYLRTGYYHPMSYYGGVPGVQFAEYARFDPCGGQICQPEACSYFAGVHLKTQLQKDCLNPMDLDTCVSYCGPKLP